MVTAYIWSPKLQLAIRKYLFPQETYSRRFSSKYVRLVGLIVNGSVRILSCALWTCLVSCRLSLAPLIWTANKTEDKSRSNCINCQFQSSTEYMAIELLPWARLLATIIVLATEWYSLQYTWMWDIKLFLLQNKARDKRWCYFLPLISYCHKSHYRHDIIRLSVTVWNSKGRLSNLQGSRGFH